MSVSQDKNGVIHAAVFLWHIDNMIDAVLSLSKRLNKPHVMCWNGTLATVSPNDTRQSVFDGWIAAREDYQADKDQLHEALCSCCKS